jgi:hypothetical protein
MLPCRDAADCFCYRDANDNLLFSCSEFSKHAICLDDATRERRVVQIDASSWVRVEEREEGCAPCTPNLVGADRSRRVRESAVAVEPEADRPAEEAEGGRTSP